MAKAIALFSGGLDSSLAVRVMLDQDISVTAVHFHSTFTCSGASETKIQFIQDSAAELGVEVIIEDNSEELLELVKHPCHGHGRNVNPCIDCRIRNIRRAGEIMREIGADFIITGEVIGQRPMSQNRGALDLVIRQSGLEGLVLRPLCAKRLPPTIPEQEGWVNRENLLELGGRTRKPQMELARRYGLKLYSSPAGGCLLTDPGFSARMRDLMEANPDCDLNDVELIKFGRHFRLSPKAKAIVGRDHAENEAIESLARVDDILLDVATRPGPVTLVRGAVEQAELNAAGAITMRYSQASKLDRTTIRAWQPGNNRDSGSSFETSPADQALLDRLRISHEKNARSR